MRLEAVQRVVAVELDGLLARGVEDQADGDRERARVLLELDEQLVVAPGVVDAELLALDDERAPVLVGRARRDLDDVDARRVVVAQRHLYVAHRDLVEGLVGGDRRVLDDHDAVALRPRVVDGEQVDPLLVLPVGGVEGEDDGAVVLVDEHAVDALDALELARVVADAGCRRAARAHPQGVGLAVGERVAAGDRLRVREGVVGFLLRRARHRDGHVDERARVARQVDRVGVDRLDADAAALADRRALVALVVDDHLATIRRREVVVEPVDREAVVERVERGAHAVVDRAADALELARDDVLGDVAGDVDRVRAEAADDAIGDAEGGRLDEELVVALEPRRPRSSCSGRSVRRRRCRRR
jgi:hypothetical protein